LVVGFVLPGCGVFGWISLDAYFAAVDLSAVVGTGADSKEPLWYSHNDLVSDAGDPLWGRTLVDDFESNVSADR